MKIKIGGRAFTVRALTLEEETSLQAVGVFFCVEQQIAVSPRIMPDHQAETLLHEIAHAIWHVFGLPERADEERVSHAFGAGMAQVFRDSPALVAAVELAAKGKAIFK